MVRLGKVLDDSLGSEVGVRGVSQYIIITVLIG